MNQPRILIAGIGNIFFGDDSFGVEVAQELRRRELPHGVSLIDFGIRGLDLMYSLLDDYSTVILVDAVSRGAVPGTLFVIEPEPDATPADVEPRPQMLDPHTLDPVEVLRAARAMGSSIQRILLVGCEPAILGTDEEMVSGLSEPVRRSVGPAIELIESLVAESFLKGPSLCMPL
ncbi:MAG: hybD [Planctomycetaceae bacterium]|nr:hybD [Planctomycetaceae bacterium]